MPGKPSAKPRLTRREKKALVSSLVDKANSNNDILFQMREWTTFNKEDVNLNIEYRTSKNLCEEEMDQIFSLLQENMEELYINSDWGWSETKKKEELADENARFLLAKTAEKEIVAFSHFRFDVEGSYPVLYCYELQVKDKIQRKGLGKFIMDILFLVAFQFKMAKIMLTVFTHNTVGIDFYMKCLGFRRDETCPYEEEEMCYVILCKFIDKCEVNNIKNKMHAR